MTQDRIVGLPRVVELTYELRCYCSWKGFLSQAVKHLFHATHTRCSYCDAAPPPPLTTKFFPPSFAASAVGMFFWRREEAAAAAAAETASATAMPQSEDSKVDINVVAPSGDAGIFGVHSCPLPPPPSPFSHALRLFTHVCVFPGAESQSFTIVPIVRSFFFSSAQAGVCLKLAGLQRHDTNICYWLCSDDVPKGHPDRDHCCS